MMSEQEKQRRLVATARTTGIWYLLMAVSGILGFMVFHSQVYDADPRQTLTNLLEAETVARLRMLFELAIIVSQALTAVWFYRLFREMNAWAALATAVWGAINAVAIMISAIAMGAAIQIAPSSHTLEAKLVSIELLTALISNAWGVGALFFGLWLMPMGYIITSSKRMPVWLGRTLILGGTGYVISVFFKYAGISGPWAGTLTIPATVGEFWMIGYLLIFGIRPVPD